MGKKKQTTAVEDLKKKLKKTKLGKVIGLTRNQQTQKAIEDAFGSNF